MLYEIQPTGPARRLATQQVGYDQKGKSAVQRHRLQQRRLFISGSFVHDSNVIAKACNRLGVGKQYIYIPMQEYSNVIFCH